MLIPLGRVDVDPFAQESDKLSEEDMFRFLLEMKKPAAVLSRRFKSIPGTYPSETDCLLSVWSSWPSPYRQSED